MVYAIGLAPSMPGYRGMPGGSRGGGFPGGFGRGRGAHGGGPPVADHPDEGLAKIAGVTGGGYFELTSTSDLASTFSRVAEELHRQYALGFTPDKLDGKMHTIEVRVAGATELVARHVAQFRGRKGSGGGRDANQKTGPTRCAGSGGAVA